MNDKDEVDFLRQAQRGFRKKSSYWIAGSTDAAPIALITLTQYLTPNSDTIVLSHFYFGIKM